jgi:hypothetical protein
MQIFNRVYEGIKKKRQKILSGEVNCIPCSFKRFSTEWPGIERGKYYNVTAQQKVGKTQLMDKMFLYDPLFYAFNSPDKVRIKIFYFSLEISAEEKYKQFLCHLLYVLSRGKIRVSQRDLNSVSVNEPLDQKVLDILQSPEYLPYYKFFEERVTLISDVRNPTGIHKIMKDYAKNHGKWTKKKIEYTDKLTGEIETREVNDYYTPDDEDEYVFCIIDHIGLISTESENGNQLNLHQSISKLSATYLIELRDNYKYIPCVVQQQALAGESTENVKIGKLKPSVADLGDNKLTSRDCNVMFGIFSPFRHNIKDYEGYDITRFRDNIRFMEIMISREGGNGMTCPLFFDGAVNYFKELPHSSNTMELSKFYALIDNINAKKRAAVANVLIKFKNKNGKNRRYFWNVWRR